MTCLDVSCRSPAPRVTKWSSAHAYHRGTRDTAPDRTDRGNSNSDAQFKNSPTGDWHAPRRSHNIITCCCGCHDDSRSTPTSSRQASNRTVLLQRFQASSAVDANVTSLWQDETSLSPASAWQHRSTRNININDVRTRDNLPRRQNRHGTRHRRRHQKVTTARTTPKSSTGRTSSSST